MRALIFFMVSACARIQEPDAAPANDASPSDTNSESPDTRTDGALRPDGCPVKPADLRLPCELGKRCEYEDQCVLGWDSRVNVFVCESGFEMSRRWVNTSASCVGRTRPDGCPFAPPPNSTTAVCTEEGKTCEYRACGSPNEWENGVAHWTCSRDASGMFYREQPLTKCP